MGIRSILGLEQDLETIQASLPGPFPIVSPWSSDDLQRVIFDDIFGAEFPVNTRAQAMGFPALSRGRNLICSTIARLPLRCLVGQAATPSQPEWLARAGAGQSPALRLVWTVDDLIFYGWSVWWRDRNPDGSIAQAYRIEPSSWEIDDDYQIRIHGQVVDEASVIVIPGFHEGILNYGRNTLDDTRALYAAVRGRIQNPVPQLDLHQVAGDPLTDPEIDALIARWSAARQGKNGGVAYTSAGLEVNELGGGADAQLMIEARNAAAVDLARLIGISASLVDATAPKASLNYETTAGRNQEFVDFDLGLYTTPIAARLSLDDVTPPGTRIDFDLTHYTAPDPNPLGPDHAD